MMSISKKSSPSPASEVADLSATSKASTPRLMVLQLRGSEEQMGRQHGQIMRELGQWEPSLDYYPRMPEYLLHGALPPVLMRTAGRAIIEQSLKRMESHRSSKHTDRAKAFVEAIGRPSDFGRYFFVMDVLQNLVGWSSKVGLDGAAYRMGTTVPPACTSLAVWGDSSEDGRVLHARNFDFPGVGLWDSGPVVVFCTPEKGLRYGFITTRGADAVGVSAFNEAGLTLTMHTRFHSEVVLKGTGVLDLGHEIISQAKTLDEAVAIARKGPIASSWGVLVSSAKEKRAISIEAAGYMVRVVEPGQDEDFLACANRYRHPDMVRQEVTVSPAFIANSNGRESMARQYGQRGGASVADLKRMLASHEDPHVPGYERAAGSVISQPMTVKSIVVDHDNQVVHLATGLAPTAEGVWHSVPFAWRDEVGHTAVLEPGTPLEREPSRYEAPKPRRALDAFIEAVKLHQQGGAHEDIHGQLKRASILDPEDATYQFLTGALALKEGHIAEAEAHLEQGLEFERAEFYRGQLLLWASRAAEARGHKALARAHRKALLSTSDPLLERYRQAGESEQHTPYDRAKFAKIKVQPHLIDAGI